jgi:hypothetical protein
MHYPAPELLRTPSWRSSAQPRPRRHRIAGEVPYLLGNMRGEVAEFQPLAVGVSSAAKE